MKIVQYFVVAAFAALLIYVTLSLPPRGFLDKIADKEVGLAGAKNPPAYYIKNSYHDAHTPNMVSVILADYRSYDTLGEETVILTAALVCFLILRRKRKNNEKL